jgi:hypothetical protein
MGLMAAVVVNVKALLRNDGYLAGLAATEGGECQFATVDSSRSVAATPASAVGRPFKQVERSLLASTRM